MIVCSTNQLLQPQYQVFLTLKNMQLKSSLTPPFTNKLPKQPIQKYFCSLFFSLLVLHICPMTVEL